MMIMTMKKKKKKKKKKELSWVEETLDAFEERFSSTALAKAPSGHG